MDWRNEESDHSSVENFMWDEKSLTKSKSNVSISGALGCNVSCQGVQVSFNGCKESRSFTSAFERLELEAEIDCRNDEFSHRKTCDAQTETFDDFKQELIDGLKTRDSFFCRSVHHNSDILNFQGTRYSPEDIARYWKKDSRMWLWKSVRLRRRIKREQFDSTIKDEEERQ